MLTKKKLNNVAKLCKEVEILIAQVQNEADATRHWNPETRSYEASSGWEQHGGTALTGTLRRRSMDLSRALIELRKS